MFGYIKKPSEAEIKDLAKQIYNDLHITAFIFNKGEVVGYFCGSETNESEQELLRLWKQSGGEADEVRHTNIEQDFMKSVIAGKIENYFYN